MVPLMIYTARKSGVATVHCLRLWEKILDLEPKDIDAEALIGSQEPEENIHSDDRKRLGKYRERSTRTMAIKASRYERVAQRD